jgi:hypothetical protein
MLKCKNRTPVLKYASQLWERIRLTIRDHSAHVPWAGESIENRPYKRLVAAALRRAALDAEAGDVYASLWLMWSDEARLWADCLGIRRTVVKIYAKSWIDG